MLKMSCFWVLPGVFPVPAGPRNGLSGGFRPIWTHWSLCDRQFPPYHMEVGQGEQGEELGRVLGQPPVSHLAIAPQVLDDAEGMLDPCPYAIALLVERPIRAVEPLVPASLAMHPPDAPPRFG